MQKVCRELVKKPERKDAKGVQRELVEMTERTDAKGAQSVS